MLIITDSFSVDLNLQMERCLILMAFLYKGSCIEPISPLSDSVLGLEGDSVNLSCNYSGMETRLFWYQQQPRSSPRFLMAAFSDNTAKLSVKNDEDKKQFHLTIISAELTDSALYYCALQPTLQLLEVSAVQKPSNLLGNTSYNHLLEGSSIMSYSQVEQ